MSDPGQIVVVSDFSKETLRSVIPQLGPSVDRTRERLGTSDTAIIAMRRLLLEEVRALQRGQEPLAPHQGEVYWVRSAPAVLKRDVEFEAGCRSVLEAEV